jgi:hypothetical protein
MGIFSQGEPYWMPKEMSHRMTDEEKGWSNGPMRCAGKQLECLKKHVVIRNREILRSVGRQCCPSASVRGQSLVGLAKISQSLPNAASADVAVQGFITTCATSRQE